MREEGGEWPCDPVAWRPWLLLLALAEPGQLLWGLVGVRALGHLQPRGGGRRTHRRSQHTHNENHMLGWPFPKPKLVGRTRLPSPLLLQPLPSWAGGLAGGKVRAGPHVHLVSPRKRLLSAAPSLEPPGPQSLLGAER